LRKSPLDPSIQFQELSEQTEGYSGADISFLCSLAGKNAIKESLAIKQEQEEENECKFSERENKNEKREEEGVPFLTKSHFIKALEMSRASVSSFERKVYELTNEMISNNTTTFDEETILNSEEVEQEDGKEWKRRCLRAERDLDLLKEQINQKQQEEK